MAEGWTPNVRCRYFANGMCREGDNCRYMHQNDVDPGPSTSVAMPPVNPVYSMNRLCRFYQRGQCTYGDHCRFSHDVNNISSSAGSRDKHTSPGTSTRKVTILKKQGNSADSGLGEDSSENWVNAPEFIPSGKEHIPNPAERVPTRTYADIVRPPAGTSNTPNNLVSVDSKNKICPYLVDTGECKYGAECMYTHGEICDLCGLPCLHPKNKEQRKEHISECIKEHERNMELSFAVARSKDKTCGVCFEVVMEKAPREQRFGILPNCNHCFCLSCIRKWRQARQFDNKIIRACPECRVTSDYVCPSSYWVDTKDEKDKLINNYRIALSVKDCKYFREGRGKCPFGNKCFYRHAYPDGTIADVGPPVRRRRDRDIDVLQQIILWDFLEDRENRWLYSIDELEDLVAFFSDSEDSDWSEYDFFFD